MNYEEIRELKAEIAFAAARLGSAKAQKEELSYLPKDDDKYKKAVSDHEKAEHEFFTVLNKMDTLAIDTSRNYPPSVKFLGKGKWE